MKEHTLNRSVDATLPASEPNFDDERTLLLARRVVPLAKIDAKERRRRHWFLGGAFALAMMLGAASALLASYLKLQTIPHTAIEISNVEAPVARVAVAAEPAESESSVTEDSEEAATSVTPKRAPAVMRRATVDRNKDVVRPRSVGEVDEDEEIERIRDAVLIDAWQERRARRANRREPRNRVDHHDRDLSNLDEIFEGRKRRP